MEEEIIKLLKMKHTKMLSYQDVVDELDLTQKQQMILVSKFKSFKRLEKTYRYNEYNHIETIIRIVDDVEALSECDQGEE